MKMYSVMGNTQKLDGGSMFGNCPRAVWQRWCSVDEQHRIDLACRCLLVREDSGRTLLFETGIGAFFEPKLRERFGVQEPEHVLLNSLGQHGIQPADVDVIVLSHLHFDHAGGLLNTWEENEAPSLAFENAQVVVGAKAWHRAQRPHARDRASFIPALEKLLVDSNRLVVVNEGATGHALLGENYRFHYSDGHTPGLLLTEINSPSGSIIFMGDLIPGVPWIHAPITMGYDRYPELLIDEKIELLQHVVTTGAWAFFTHDAQTAACQVERSERGKFVAKNHKNDLHWQ